VTIERVTRWTPNVYVIGDPQNSQHKESMVVRSLHYDSLTSAQEVIRFIECKRARHILEPG